MSSFDPSNHLASLREVVLNLLFPARCVSCGKEGGWLCPTCSQQISFYEMPWPSFADPFEPLEQVRSAAHLSGALRKAIHEFKYRGLRALASPLGQVLYRGWEKDPWPVDALVPVPLHPRRERARGYNQSALLARELAARTGLQMVDQALVRTVNTAPQVGLSAIERAENVHQAFTCPSNSLNGRRVLLIDDVLTTGATMRACASALLQAGALSVWGLTLAHE